MQARRLSGLFINCVEAQDSIFESGKMVFQSLLNSEKYLLDYIEIDINNHSVPANYDFYLFNYHILTMSWLNTKSLREQLQGLIMTIVLEVSPNNPFVYCSPDDFDVYCVLDPTLHLPNKNVFAFPRPLEVFNDSDTYVEKEIPVIGSFGFATTGKGFDHLIDAVNKEFDRAIVRINIPYSTYADEKQLYAKQLAKLCKDKAKDGIEVIVTHDFMSKAELIKWCGQNTINCFLYDRNMPGLSATTDQAISSGRPLIISKNNTFRHILKYIKPFPYQSLKEAIEKTPKIVKKIQADWSAETFRKRFEEVLDGIDFSEFPKKNAGTIELTVSKQPEITFFGRVKDKLAIRTRLRNFSKTIGLQPKTKDKFDSEVSHSKYWDDVAVCKLFKDLAFKNMSYLNIGADNPAFACNTYLFYENGFKGVLVTSNSSLCKKLKMERPKDIVLNARVLMCDEFEADSKSNVKQAAKTPSMSINLIISNYFTECPDFVSIDVEGWDLKILETFDFDIYSPAVFCVETPASNNDGSTYIVQDVYDFFDGKGYFPYKESFTKTIFVNKNLYDFCLYQQRAKQS